MASDPAAAPDAGSPRAPLSQLRLLVALDAFLRAGSVSGAAQALEISVPAASRLLAQLRGLYDDPILERSGRLMVPTPLATTLRRRVGALADEARALAMTRVAALSPAAPPSAKASENRKARLPLRTTAAPRLEGEPDPDALRRRLEERGGAADPQDRLAAHIALVAAPGRHSRTLSHAAARDAFDIILDGQADPVQVGALLAAIQQRGLVAPELAGLLGAARARLPERPALSQPFLDWPVYPSPRNRRPPWYLVAARLLAEGGLPVALHGFTLPQGPRRDMLERLSVPQVDTLDEAARVLREGRSVYLNIETIAPQLAGLSQLYSVLAMRTGALLALQLLDPLQSRITLSGAPSSSGSGLLSGAVRLQGEGQLVAVQSHRDVAQATPHRLMQLAIADSAQDRVVNVAPTLPAAPESLPAQYPPSEMLEALWNGRAREAAVLATILDTVALGLLAASPGTDFGTARENAASLWERRRPI